MATLINSDNQQLLHDLSEHEELHEDSFFSWSSIGNVGKSYEPACGGSLANDLTMMGNKKRP